MSSENMPGYLESALQEIKVIKSELNDTAAELHTARQNTVVPALAEIKALKNELQNGNAAKTTKDTLDMASSQTGNGNSPTTFGLAVAAVGGAPLAKEASLPHTNGDCSRPNLNPVASRASTSDDFGGCNIFRGEDVHKDLHTRKSLSDMEHDGLGNASTSGMGTNAHMGTIDQRNGIGNGNSTGHPHDGDAEGTSPSMSEEEMPAMARQGTPSDVTLKLITIEDIGKSSPTKSSRHLDIDKPISFMTPCVPLPNEYVQDSNLTPAQPNDTTRSTNEIVEEPRAKVSPDDLQPGDQVVERVKRIHQGGLAPGPNGQPISAPGKTLLTIVSAQGTKYSLSDKNLAPGQQIIETVETIHEGFALPETPSISKRRWSWLGPLASPVATPKGAGSPAPSASGSKTTSSSAEDGGNVNKRPAHARSKSSFLDNLLGRNPEKQTANEKGKETGKQGQEVSAPSEIQQPQTQVAPEEKGSWFDKILDKIAGQNDKEKVPTGQA